MGKPKGLFAQGYQEAMADVWRILETQGADAVREYVDNNLAVKPDLAGEREAGPTPKNAAPVNV